VLQVSASPKEYFISVTVSLKEIVDHLNMVGDESTAYLNRKTGELVTLGGEELSAAEEREDMEDYPEWQREGIALAREIQDSEDYLELPTKFDIHEYRIVEEFCRSAEPEELREQLLRKIRGGGAFGRFKREIYKLKIEQDWYRFRDAELERIAMQWLEANEVAYRRDSGGEGRRTEQGGEGDPIKGVI